MGEDTDRMLGGRWDGGWELRVGWRVANAEAAQPRDRDKDSSDPSGLRVQKDETPIHHLIEADGNTSLE